MYKYIPAILKKLTRFLKRVMRSKSKNSCIILNFHMLMHINFNAVILFNLILYHIVLLAIGTENSVHILEAEINNDKFKHFQ